MDNEYYVLKRIFPFAIVQELLWANVHSCLRGWNVRFVFVVGGSRICCDFLKGAENWECANIERVLCRLLFFIVFPIETLFSRCWVLEIGGLVFVCRTEI